MNRTDLFRLIVGCMILLSVALTVWVSRWWALLTVFIGLNLVQSAFTRWCLLNDILKALGVQEACEQGACEDGKD